MAEVIHKTELTKGGAMKDHRGGDKLYAQGCINVR